MAVCIPGLVLRGGPGQAEGTPVGVAAYNAARSKNLNAGITGNPNASLMIPGRLPRGMGIYHVEELEEGETHSRTSWRLPGRTCNALAQTTSQLKTTQLKRHTHNCNQFVQHCRQRSAWVFSLVVHCSQLRGDEFSRARTWRFDGLIGGSWRFLIRREAFRGDHRSCTFLNFLHLSSLLLFLSLL